MNTTQTTSINSALDQVEFLAGASLAALERWDQAGDYAALRRFFESEEARSGEYAALRRFFETRKEAQRRVSCLPLVQTLRGEVEIAGGTLDEQRRVELTLLRIAGRFVGVRAAE